MHDFGWGWGVLMVIGTVAFWALVIYGIVWLARGGATTQQRSEPRPEDPKEILKRRLAAGEISIDEYDRLQETIQARPREPQPV